MSQIQKQLFIGRLMDLSLEPQLPFGVLKDPDMGKHGGHRSIQPFTAIRWIALEHGGCD